MSKFDPIPLQVELLTAASFAPFGDVIEPSQCKKTYAINNGTTTRFHDLANIDVGQQNGRAVLSLFRAQPRTFPIEIAMLERHPLGSQAFIPVEARPYLVLVGKGDNDTPRCFLVRDRVGVNYHRGTWHHPLLALESVSDFWVIDRAGNGNNCEEIYFSTPYVIDGLFV